MSTGYEDTVVTAVIDALNGISEQSGDNNTIKSVRELDRFDSDEGDLPSARIEWLGESMEQHGSELTVDLRLRLDVKLSRDPASGVATSRQNRLLKHDVVKALTNIDYTANDSFLRSITATPYTAEDTDETAEGVVFDVVFGYAVDFDSPQTATAPLS